MKKFLNVKPNPVYVVFLYYEKKTVVSDGWSHPFDKTKFKDDICLSDLSAQGARAIRVSGSKVNVEKTMCKDSFLRVIQVVLFIV